MNELKVIFNSLKLHPTNAELKLMISEISDNDNFTIPFESVSVTWFLTTSSEQ